MKKIDVHAHLIGNICGIGSEGELRPIGNGKAQYASGKIIQLIPEQYGDYTLTPEILTKVMKENDVEYSICLQGNYAGFQNLYTYEAMNKYPNLLGAATYDPFFKNKDKIIKNLFDDLKFKIIKMEVSNGSGLMANHHTISLNGKVMNEVYKMANERRLIFYIDIGRPGNNCYQIDNLVKVCKKYKQMKFIICHLTAPQHNQIDILKDNMKKLNFENVYFDLAALPNNTKQPYPFDEAISYIKEAIDIVGSNKLMWGSDFPAAMNYCSYEESYKYIEDSQLLSKMEKENILYNNAYKVFKDLL
ncbi:MAG: amidohydrolase family protein [Anaeroplasma sp.]